MGPGLVKTKRTLVEAESPQGRHWNPWTRKAFEAGEDRPPEDCAKATMKLIARAGPELSGETFSTSDVLAE